MFSKSTTEGAGSGLETLSDYLDAVLARKWFLLLYTLGVLLTAYLAVQVMTERYQATASLLVRLGRENTELPVTVDRGLFTSLGVREEEVNANIQLLKSRVLMEETVDAIGLEAFEQEPAQQATLVDKAKRVAKDAVRWTKNTLRDGFIALNLKDRLDQREKTVDYCSKFLSVELVRNSDAIELNLQHPSRELAVRVLETLIDRYLEHHVQVRRNVITQDFFSDQVIESAEKLESVEQQILKLRESQGLSSINTQRELLLKRISLLTEQLEHNQQDAAFLLKSRGFLQREPDNLQLALATEGEMLPDRSVEGLKSYATKLHLELIELGTVESNSSPGYETIEQQIYNVQGLLDAGLEERHSQLVETIELYEQELDQLNDAQMRLEQLERERELLQQSYFAFSKRREEARVSEELDLARASNVAILAPPTTSYVPVYPKKLLVMLAAFIAAVVSGLALVLLPHWQHVTVWDRRPTKRATTE